MHKVFEILMGAYLTLLHAVTGLADWLSLPTENGTHSYTAAALVISFAVLTGICAFWAVATRLRFSAYRKAMRISLGQAQGDIRFREAMISACPEAIAVLGSDMHAPLSYRGGAGLLQACLDGPDAPLLATRLETLLANGTAFTVTARTASFPQVSVRGCAVGSRAAIFFRIEKNNEPETDYASVLDSLPIPVWIRNRHLVLTWANRAFLNATGSATMRDALLSDAQIDSSERDLARGTTEGNEVTGARRFAVIQGERRALSIDMKRLPDKGVAGFAMDMTPTAKAEARLQLQKETSQAIFNRLDDAIAIFGADLRLVTYNTAYAKLWQLPEEWLDIHPSFGDVLDRLREMRRLPEQRHFSLWKQEHMRPFQSEEQTITETWHLPGGTSIAVQASPCLSGGAVYVFRDISELLRTQESHELLKRSQRAVLDTVENATALFGPDGRLKIHNASFANLWQLEEGELAGEPHISLVADLCAERTGRDGIWSMIAAGVNSADLERFGEWGQLVRADGRCLTLSFSRLPDGMTLIAFHAVDDQTRFEKVVAEATVISAA